VIHYCMGGLEIDADSRVVKKVGNNMVAIDGLYAAGEIAGGVHGNNRLGGNSLLDCVVFGRVAGKHAAMYMLGESYPTSLAELSGALKAGGAAASGDAGGEAAAGGAAVAAAAQFSLDDVASHNNKSDCWVVLHDRVLDVTDFLKDHPGGELAILTFAGKDATAEFDMIHPPDVIEKYLDKSAHMGVVAGSALASGGGASGGGLGAPLLGSGSDDKKVWGDYPHNTTVNMFTAGWLMVVAFLKEICFTIFTTVPVKITGDRTAVTRSAFFLIMFMVIHAIGNLHVFLGPDDFNGYGYFYVRLYWTGFGLNANIVEEYVLLAALMHIIVASKRTLDININMPVTSGKLNMAISGIVLLVYMVIHLFQFRFGETEPYKVRPPPYMINFNLSEFPHLFYTADKSVPEVVVRDIYKLEYDLFQNWGWVWYYLISTAVFATHFWLGWEKVVPASSLEIPKSAQWTVTVLGWIICVFVAMCYFSFPIYCYFSSGPGLGLNGVY